MFFGKQGNIRWQLLYAIFRFGLCNISNIKQQFNSEQSVVEPCDINMYSVTLSFTEL